MKVNYFLSTIGLAALLCAGCANQPQKQMRYIGSENARELALSDTGVSSSAVDFISTDLKKRSGIDYYQVCFLTSGKKYSYDIDALSGIIIDRDIPEQSDNDTVVSPDKDTSKPNSAETPKNSDNSMLTIEEAQAKALNHAGLSAKQVTFVKSQPDMEDGLYIYDIEFYTKKHCEYSYNIDAYTGKVLSLEYDAKENYRSSSDQSRHEMLSEQQAMKLALDKVPGADVHDICEFETDSDDDHMIYEGKILHQNIEYEFEIDAYSGNFCKWQEEPIEP